MPDPIHCPTCGAPLTVRNRFVTVVTCEFCGGVSLYDGGRLDPTGRSVEVVQVPSSLYLDATGQIGGRDFRVLGRLVYEYDGGYWTEWFLDVEGAGRAWLVEDEGAFSILQEQPDVTAPPFEEARPAGSMRIGSLEMFVDEVGEATVVGAEGQLGGEILPGEVIRYVDGVAGDREVSVEYGERAVEVYVGRPIPRDALVVDEETYG